MSQPTATQASQTRPPGGNTTGNPPKPMSRGDAQAAAQDAKSKVSEAARELDQQATAANEQVKQQASEAVRVAKQKTYEAAERAKQSGRQYADQKKKLAADEIGVFSGAIRKASAKLHEEDHPSIASYLDAAVERLDQMRESLQQKSVGALLEDAGALARRRPELVYGGMFFAGLAAIRFLKASNKNKASDGQGSSSADTVPPAAGATRPATDYPQPPQASTIHRTPGFPTPEATLDPQRTPPGEIR